MSGSYVTSLALSPDDAVLYTGGYISTQGRSTFAPLDANTGLVKSFNPAFPTATVASSILLYGNRVYVGGGFTSVGGKTTRQRYVKLNTCR